MNNIEPIKVTIVILNWNGKYFLEKFLPSIIEHSGNAEIVIADNASSDDSISFLNSIYPNIRLISMKKNKGYAGGYNEALKQIDSKYYILLNSDLEVSPNWITPIIDEMEKDEAIGAAQPKIISFHQKDEFEYAGAAGGFIDKYGYPFCQGRVFNNLEKDINQYNEIREVFWATGAAMFVRAKYFHELGGLDEDFFAHMEEIDFCWRLKLNGYKVMSIPFSKIYHIGGGTLPKNSSRKTYLNFRNNFALLLKNLPKNRILKVFAIRFFLDGVAAIKFLFEGNYKDTFAVLKAHFYFYKNIRRILKKRKGKTIKPISDMYMKSIVVEHYFKKKTKFTELNPKDFS